jgi:hypothetical protein
MKKVVCVAVLLFMGRVSFADEASKRAKIHELFLAMHMDKTMELVMDQAADQGAKTAMSMFPEVTLTAAQQKVIDDSVAQVRVITREGLAWSKLEPSMIDVYAESYSESTIDGLLEFYKSPAGIELLAKQTEVMMKSSAVAQKAMLDVQPRLQQVVKDMMTNPALMPAPPKK